LCLCGFSKMNEVFTILNAFLRSTSDKWERHRALRALTLHMLEGHTPRFFRDASLHPVLLSAIDALKDIPIIFESGLHPEDGMARVDAWYILQQRGQPATAPDRGMLSSYLEWLVDSGYLVYAWLLGEMAYILGVDARLRVPNRPFRDESRLIDLYWLTHLFLLETRFLQRRLPTIGWNSRIEELLNATSWIVEQRHVDLGGEVAVCLQLAGRHSSLEHEALIDLIMLNRQPDGTVLDPSAEDSQETAAHSTAAALLALAGAKGDR
jgi:D-amino peptidase